MADIKISALPAATVPLTGTEVLPIVQSSTTKKVAVSDLFSGGVPAANITGTLPLGNGGTGASTAAGARSNLGLGSAAVLNAGVASGVATLDSSGTVPLSQMNPSIISGTTYRGLWNASTNTPTITSSVGTAGYFYTVSVAGSTNIDGTSSWAVGDTIIFNGTIWQKTVASGNFADITGTSLTLTTSGNTTTGQAFTVTQGITGYASGDATYNNFTINTTTVGPTLQDYGYLFQTNVNSGSQGSKIGIISRLDCNSAGYTSDMHVAVVGQATGKVPTTNSVNVYGGNFYGNLDAGAAGYSNVTGAEFNTECKAGSSVVIKTGVQVVSQSGDVVHGSVVDAAISIGAVSGSAGYTQGILFSHVNSGAPMMSDGELIKYVGSGDTLAFGINFNDCNFTQAAFASPYFAVDGSGNLAAKSLGTSGNVSFTSTAQRIRGDMNNATITNRLGFQASAGSTSSLHIFPNASTGVAAVTCESSIDGASSQCVQLNCIPGVESRLSADRRGASAYTPLCFYTGGVKAVTIDTNQEVTFAGKIINCDVKGNLIGGSNNGNTVGGRALQCGADSSAPGIYWGAGDPNTPANGHSAFKGSLFLRTDPPDTSHTLYIATGDGYSWTPVTP